MNPPLSAGPPQDRQSRRGDPAVLPAGDFRSEGIERPADPVIWILGGRVVGVQVPGPVSVPLLLESGERRAHPGVVAIPERREDVKADQDVVVIVDGVVEPEPWRVWSLPLPEQEAIQVEFRTAFNRAEDFRAAGDRGQRREGGERFPAVQGPRRRSEAVPPAVLLLVTDEPVDRRLQMRVLCVAEAEDHPHRVSGDAYSTPEAAEFAG